MSGVSAQLRRARQDASNAATMKLDDVELQEVVIHTADNAGTIGVPLVELQEVVIAGANTGTGTQNSKVHQRRDQLLTMAHLLSPLH